MTTVERINVAVSRAKDEWRNSPTCECGHVSFRHHERKGDCDGLGRNPFGSKCECKEYRPKRTPLPWATDGALAFKLLEEIVDNAETDVSLELMGPKDGDHDYGCATEADRLDYRGDTLAIAIGLAWCRLHNIDITEG